MAPVSIKETHEKYTPEQIIAALGQSRGMVSVAARLLSCDRGTIYDYMDRYPAIKLAITNQRELSLDTAELKLVEAITKGQPWAIVFYLKTQGRGRGYIEKQDIGLDALTLEQLVLLAQQKRKEKRTAHE